MGNLEIANDGHVMSSTDQALGRFDEGSRNPWFGLQDSGIQWPEGRAFARTANVHAMARLAEVLCGLSQFVSGDSDAADASLRGYIPLEDRGQALKDIAGTLQVVLDLCPAIISALPVHVDESWGMPPYIAEDRMAPIIQRAFDQAKRQA